MCKYDVPQGSVLGPVLCTQYASPPSQVPSRCCAGHDSYTDDVNDFSVIDQNSESFDVLKATIDATDWYANNEMLLNGSESIVVLIGTRAQRTKFDEFDVCHGC